MVWNHPDPNQGDPDDPDQRVERGHVDEVEVDPQATPEAQSFDLKIWPQKFLCQSDADRVSLGHLDELLEALCATSE